MGVRFLWEREGCHTIERPFIWKILSQKKYSSRIGKKGDKVVVYNSVV